jgi:RNA polymerase sigma-70 factor (ECF subfamily)
MDGFAQTVLEPARRELTAYLCRLVLRPSVADELTQTTFLRALECIDSLPAEPERARAWVFRVATNLAFDELKRHSTRRESLVVDLREAAESDPEFMARSRDLIGTPETKAIAREHVAACFACVLHNLSPQRAASVLLREVSGFSNEETAEILDATPGQVKNWLQEGRAAMLAKYEDTCALVRKEGVCHQCVELDGFMQAGQGSPASGKSMDFDARIAVVRGQSAQPWSAWHRMLFGLLDELE